MTVQSPVNNVASDGHFTVMVQPTLVINMASPDMALAHYIRLTISGRRPRQTSAGSVVSSSSSRLSRSPGLPRKVEFKNTKYFPRPTSLQFCVQKSLDSKVWRNMVWGRGNHQDRF